MAETSKIEWTDATWNPITGCSVVSPGCTNCYAMRLAGTRLHDHPSRAGLTQGSKAGPVWTGEVRLNAQWLDQPLRWKGRRRIFVCAHGDLFHESVPDEWIDQVFAVMALARRHTFQVLTKRARRMRDYLDHPRRRRVWEDVMRNKFDAPCAWPPIILPNVWLGVSVEDQQRADERIPDLLASLAAVRFVSAEPLLGPVDLNIAWHGETALDGECWGECLWCEHGHPPLWNCQRGLQADADYGKTHSGLDWVIAGGESGPGARPMHPDWVRSLRDQCAAAGIPFFFKQWGEWAPQVGAVDGWTIDDNPEVSRFDHHDWEGDHWGQPYRPMWCDDVEDDTVSRIGKKRAGRLLDGVEHSAMPEATDD